MNRNGYANPEVLVETEWAAAHLDDPLVRFVEVDVDTTAYDSGHIPGAAGWNWQKDTQQPIRRDILERAALDHAHRVPAEGTRLVGPRPARPGARVRGETQPRADRRAIAARVLRGA